MHNPTPYSDEIWAQIRGEIKIRCVKSGGYTMSSLGQYAWAESEEKSLFDETLPATIRVGDYRTAKNMVTDPACELAQRLAAGDFEIVEDRNPDISPIALRRV